MTAAMTAAAVATPRPGLIERLLDWWFSAPQAAPEPAAQREAPEDLRTALQTASMCHVSALSAEYAHYLIDRHSGRAQERG